MDTLPPAFHASLGCGGKQVLYPVPTPGLPDGLAGFTAPWTGAVRLVMPGSTSRRARKALQIETSTQQLLLRVSGTKKHANFGC